MRQRCAGQIVQRACDGFTLLYAVEARLLAQVLIAVAEITQHILAGIVTHSHGIQIHVAGIIHVAQVLLEFVHHAAVGGSRLLHTVAVGRPAVTHQNHADRLVVSLVLADSTVVAQVLGADKGLERGQGCAKLGASVRLKANLLKASGYRLEFGENRLSVGIQLDDLYVDLKERRVGLVFLEAARDASDTLVELIDLGQLHRLTVFVDHGADAAHRAGLVQDIDDVNGLAVVVNHSLTGTAGSVTDTLRGASACKTVVRFHFVLPPTYCNVYFPTRIFASRKMGMTSPLSKSRTMPFLSSSVTV